MYLLPSDVVLPPPFGEDLYDDVLSPLEGFLVVVYGFSRPFLIIYRH